MSITSDPVGLPSVWDDLQGQLYLGDETFADQSRQTLSNRLLNDHEIPRLQRQASAAPLATFVAMPNRNEAIAKAYATGRYSQKEIALVFSIYYATVSRIVKPAVKLPEEKNDMNECEVCCFARPDHNAVRDPDALPWAREGQHAVEPVLHGAQH